MKLPDIPWLKKSLKILAVALIIYFTAIGFYKKFVEWQYNSVKKYVEAKEKLRDYDKDLEYLKPRGEPILWVKPGNRKTLFFIEGFRGQVGAGIYREWFKELHQKHNVNIVAPIIGLQGWRFKHRNRTWTHHEHMRQVLQIYNAYTATLPATHRVVIGSQSFGALANITINARGIKSPYASVFCAPLNTGLEYKSGGAVIRWLATQTSWLQYIIPYTKRNKNPNRAGLWDIVNKENNKHVWETIARDIINWEETLGSSVQVQKVAQYMETRLIPQVKGKRLYVCYGDDDLYFSQKGFKKFGDLLQKSGNSMTTISLEKTGHMLLFDNGGPKVKGLFVKLLTE